MSNKFHDFFSESYTQSREKFLIAAKKVNAETVSYEHPFLGSEGESLSTDVAYLGPEEPEKMLVVLSGVHGVEGFYGAALQLGLMNEAELTCISKKIGILLIHGLNPYGFSHLTRETEGNVDLNRNFIDHEKAYPSNRLYDLFADELISKKIPNFSDWPTHKEVLMQIEKKYDPSDLFCGQYNDPNGLFFGGHQPTWSSKTFYQILEDFVGDVTEVVLLDLHTGYGEKGSLELFSLYPEQTNEHKTVQELFKDEKAISEPYKATGSLIGASIKALAPSHVVAAVVEMGSISPSAIEILRESRWLALFGDVHSKEAQAVKKRIKEALCPSCDKWRKDAYRRGMRIIKQGMYYLLQEQLAETC